MNTGQLSFVRVETILSKFHTDLSSEDINEEDAVGWIGEAMEFLAIPESRTEAVCFAEVKDFEVSMPKGLQKVIQIARDNSWAPKEKCVLPEDIVDEIPETYVESYTRLPEAKVDYNPYFHLDWDVNNWVRNPYYVNHYSHVKLSNNAFFGTLVCEERHIPYDNCNDEYTIVGEVNRKFRFSFKEGFVAIAYHKNSIDERGYPMIPDQIEYITAITYYLKWKISQRYEWLGRQGFSRLAQDSERLWLKYVRQGKNSVRLSRGGLSVFKK